LAALTMAKLIPPVSMEIIMPSDRNASIGN